MRKIFQLEDRFPTGEPTIQLVLTNNGRGGRIFEKNALDRGSDAYAWLREIAPKAGHSIALVNALGSFELYDDNRNGDSFPAKPVHVGRKVTCGHKECQGSAWISDEETLVKHYKSFEKHGGIYKHHANKDPSKSLGDVMRTFWNARMQRVELLLDIEDKRDRELSQRIADANDSLAVSMGCHVKWDVCSICGHRAPTRKDYCEHAKMKMRQILANGEKVCVHNPSPRFFDISFVFRPADPTGFLFKKVAEAYELWAGHSAEAGEKYEEQLQKQADENKLSDIRKQLLGQITAIRNDPQVRAYRQVARTNAKNRKSATDKDIEKLSRYTLSTIASTFAAKNAALSTSDVARVLLKRAGLSSPDWLIDRVVALQPIMEAVLVRDSGLHSKTASLIEISDRHVDQTLGGLASEWLDKHAGLSDFILPQIPGEIGPGAYYRATAPPKTDVLTMTDPNTGAVYQTTRGAAQAADRAGLKHHLLGTALLTALYGVGLQKALPKVPWWVSLPAAAYGGHKSMEAVTDFAGPSRSKRYLVDQGFEIPGTTEFKKVSCLTLPTYFDKVAFDVIERVGDSEHPLDALTTKVAHRAPGSLISELLLDRQSDSEKAAWLCSGIDDPEIDLNALADRVGILLLS